MNMLKKSEKGFTLVEVIVVLVIIAILAAIAIPSMIGFINSANEKTAIAEARSILVAAQTLASEEYSKGSNSTEAEGNINKDTLNDLLGDEMVTDENFGDLKLTDDFKVESFWYKKSDKIYVEYRDGGFEVTDKAPDATTTSN